MGRRPLNRLELRAAAEAAEALGLNTPPERKPRAEPTGRRPKPAPTQRMRVVWAVCDLGGRTVKTARPARARIGVRMRLCSSLVDVIVVGGCDILIRFPSSGVGQN